MKTRTIPVLITVMTLALIGIIFIQYKWIEQSLLEKKKLVDHKIHQIAANVEQGMTDYNSLAFISSTPEINSIFQERLRELDENNNRDDVFEQDSVMVTYYQDFDGDTSLEQNTQVEIRILSNDSLTFRSERSYFGDKDSIERIFETIEDRSLQVQLHDINDVFERVQLEVEGTYSNKRLDSLQFAKQLSKETGAMLILFPNNWGVYDNLKGDFAIRPAEIVEWDYQIPLFKNDILQPNRYTLYLNMRDNTKSIWSSLLIMTALSLIFIAIIVFVFIYSIRLVIKHKKISAIKSDFINNMTHEFKTPLASISLAADSIIHPKVAMDQKKVSGFIEIIKAEKNKLNRHIETILEVASLKENDVAIDLTKLNANDAVQDALEKLTLLIEDRKCDVQLDLGMDLFINANAYHLENVCSNIIENGIKYSPDQPKIRISSSAVGNKIQLKIQDQGIGMTKDQQSKAFDNFYRAQKGNIHNTKGFGLGLSFVKYMVHKMKGTIRIESELNRGTTVILEFPICH